MQASIPYQRVRGKGWAVSLGAAFPYKLPFLTAAAVYSRVATYAVPAYLGRGSRHPSSRFLDVKRGMGRDGEESLYRHRDRNLRIRPLLVRRLLRW
jgi:hypothetical protein